MIVVLRLRANGPRIAVPIVVVRRVVSAMPIADVDRADADRSLAGLDFDSRDEGGRKHHADERNSARGGRRHVQPEVHALRVEQPDRGGAEPVDVREHHAEPGRVGWDVRPRNEERGRHPVAADRRERAYRAEEHELRGEIGIQVREVVVAHAEPGSRGREHRAASTADRRLIEEIGGKVVGVGERRRYRVPVDLAAATR